MQKWDKKNEILICPKIGKNIKTGLLRFWAIFLQIPKKTKIINIFHFNIYLDKILSIFRKNFRKL